MGYFCNEDSGHGVLLPLKDPSYELKLSCNEEEHKCSTVGSFEAVRRTDCEWTRTFESAGSLMGWEEVILT